MSKSKITLSPTDVSNKWKKNFVAGVPDAVKGINAVTESPMEKAASKQDKLLANYTEAVTSGRWANNTRAYPVTKWREVTATKLQQRAAGGAEAAMDKRQKFDSWLVNRINSVLPEISAMPDMTKEDSRARMNRMFDHMSEEKYKK